MFIARLRVDFLSLGARGWEAGVIFAHPPPQKKEQQHPPNNNILTLISFISSESRVYFWLAFTQKADNK